MISDDCRKMELLLQADLDGALDVGSTAALAAHVAQCPDCQATQASLAGLSARLRTELPYHAAPTRLRRSIEGAIRPAPAASAAARRWLAEHRLRWALPFGAGAVLAAALVLVVVPQPGTDSTDSVVASHIRALQPGHLMDVASTDQHTVKPWFDGRLDYAPPVKDLAPQGFPLVGGRLDYLAGRPVAALAYRRAQHVIDLYVWPSARDANARPGNGEHSGYNYVRWTEDNMAFWAVSNLNKAELSEFAERWRAAQ